MCCSLKTLSISDLVNWKSVIGIRPHSSLQSLQVSKHLMTHYKVYKFYAAQTGTRVNVNVRMQIKSFLSETHWFSDSALTWWVVSGSSRLQASEMIKLTQRMHLFELKLSTTDIFSNFILFSKEKYSLFLI